MKKPYSLTPSGCGVFTQTHFLFAKFKTALFGMILLLVLASTSPAVLAQPMVLEFNTNLGAVGTTITLPLKGKVNVSVDWGDGSSEPFALGGNKTHTYATNGIYTVAISGELTGFGAYRFSNADKLVKIKDFGSTGLTDLSFACSNAINLTEVPAQIPSAVTNLRGMFSYAFSFNQDISLWNVSEVTDMSCMFQGARVFNQDISTWNVSKVTNMSSMFASATAFNQGLARWNVSEVTNMSHMFFYAITFNQDLSSWDVSKVTDMCGVFSDATAFNQKLLSWNVSEVTNMSFMFNSATSFNQALSAWNVSKVTNMSDMFSGATAFNQDISAWNVSKVANLSFMFAGATSFNQNLSTWDVSQVTNMRYVFCFATAFNQDVAEWNVSKVTDMVCMFSNATAFNQDLSLWNVGEVTDMRGMFSDATVFDQDISTWNVSKVTNMSDMFYGVTLSVANYDALLIGWSAQTLQPGVRLDGGNSKCSCEGEIARNKNTTNSWVVTDGGSTCGASSISIEHLTPLTVWPNPCVSHLYMSDGLVGKDFSIYTIDGALVMKGVTAAASIDVSALKQGLYLVLIDGAQFKVSKN